MLIIGLCGGTGAGKTTVCKILDELNFPSINTDALSRAACDVGSACLYELVDQFGSSILLDNGELNREQLAKIAFSSKDGAESLNNITHPYIIELMYKEIARLKEDGAKAVFIDAPMLFESGMNKEFEYNVAVIADTPIRIKRVAKRSGLSYSDIESRIKKQKSNDFLIENCDYYIQNNSDEYELKEEVIAVLEKIGLL